MQVDRRQQHGTKVLVLCQDEHYPTTLVHWLREAGVCVEIASNGRQAKQLLRSGGEWVLVTDRVVPPWPGLPRVASLKRAHTSLHVVAIDRGDPDSRYVALAAGADAVVSPPLRRDIVMQALRVAQGLDRG
jgi:DNA-binding response OmpR family regulator